MISLLDWPCASMYEILGLLGPLASRRGATSKILNHNGFIQQSCRGALAWAVSSWPWAVSSWPFGCVIMARCCVSMALGRVIMAGTQMRGGMRGGGYNKYQD